MLVEQDGKRKRSGQCAWEGIDWSLDPFTASSRNPILSNVLSGFDSLDRFIFPEADVETKGFLRIVCKDRRFVQLDRVPIEDGYREGRFVWHSRLATRVFDIQYKTSFNKKGCEYIIGGKAD